MTDSKFNIRGRHVSGNARVSGDAQVSGDARVSGGAWVSDGAQVSGNAWVFGNAQVSDGAWVSDDAWVSDGVIDGSARIASSADLVQIVVDSVVWSRFPQTDGTFRTTSTHADATAPSFVVAAFDAWQEARRG